MSALVSLALAFVRAFSLMTQVPLPHSWVEKAYSEEKYSLSTLMYPIVGLCIGLGLYGLSLLASPILPPGLLAAFILSAWIFLTGALHLDGLADCIDAAWAAHASPQKALKVMGDAHIGAMATVGLCILILLKHQALLAILQMQQDEFMLLVFAPVISRTTILIYMNITPYVSESGLAQGYQQGKNRATILFILLALVLVMGIVLGPVTTLCSMFFLGLALYLWRKFWITRIGGFTGDCVGAWIEISELSVMLIFVLVVSLA